MSGGIELPWPNDEALTRLHGTMSIKQLAECFGTTTGAVRGRITKLGIAKQERLPDELVEELRAAYSVAGQSGFVGLQAIADKWGKGKASLCRKAAEMGLPVCGARKKAAERKIKPRKFETEEALRASISERMKRTIEKNGHPRGMAGKRHSAETLSRLSDISTARWGALTQAEREAQTTKAMKANLEKNGRLSSPGSGRGSWKAGWREIGGKRNYYRSRWEANYARYLEWLKARGEILDWQHEPETFWFEAIRRGVRSYLPDFRVWEKDGTSRLHEVKGWMDARSRTTLKRMAKYHPGEKIIVIREKAYNAIARAVRALIEGWEHSERAGRW